MKLKMIKNTKEEAVLELQETSPAFANSLRRSIITNINSVAVDTIDIHTNTSAIYNEILAHRIGLIPLTMNNDLKRRDECTCKGEGCTNCEVKLVLNKKGPCTVYAKDFKSTDKDVKPSHPDIIIAKLLDSQEIILDATAIVGKWTEHSKWQTASTGYQYYPELVSDKTCDSCGICKNNCPKNVIEVKNGVKLTDNYKCDLCGKCVEVCPKRALTLKKDDTHIIFKLKSISGTEPKEIIQKATKELKAQLDEVSKKL